MDKSLLLVTAGEIKTAKRTLGDGNEHTLHFKARTPNDVSVFLGSERRHDDTDKGDLAREKTRARFIAASLCDEAGEPLMTEAEALLVPATLKPQLCQMVVEGSNELGEAGKA